MLTIFSISKAFAGHIGVIQRNALASWQRLAPRVDIILLGSDPGVAEAAREFGARHVPQLEVNEYGTPLISAAFEQARHFSTQPYLMYANADMLFDDSLPEALDRVGALPAFLLSGQCWDVQIREDMGSWDAAAWGQPFAERHTRGQLRGPSAMDYFAFPRKTDFGMPRFAVGRVGWDSWLAWKCRQAGIPFIDATADIAALHQNHSYNSLQRGCQHRKGPERTLNIRLAGGLTNLLTLREASHELVAGSLHTPTGWRGCRSRLATVRTYQYLLAFKRWIQQVAN